MFRSELTKPPEHGNRVPVEIRNQFLDILSESFTIPSLAHYLRYVIVLLFAVLILTIN